MSSGVKALFVVEGHCEADFVKKVLGPFFHQRCQVGLQPILIETGKRAGGTKSGGGLTTFHQLEKAVRATLKDSSATVVTTMVDTYRFPVKTLPTEFPFREEILCETNLLEKAKRIEQGLSNYFGNSPKFIPFLMVVEFETLLFSDPDILKDRLEERAKREGHQFRKYWKTLEQSLRRCSSVEEINGGRDTHPAARLSKLWGEVEFRKRQVGVPLAEQIGLSRMREKCPHFDEWISSLETKLCP